MNCKRYNVTLGLIFFRPRGLVMTLTFVRTGFDSHLRGAVLNVKVGFERVKINVVHRFLYL